MTGGRRGAVRVQKGCRNQPADNTDGTERTGNGVQKVQEPAITFSFSLSPYH